MNSKPYNYMNESIVKKTIKDYTNYRNLLKRSNVYYNSTFASAKVKSYKQQIQLNEERWKKMEEFRKSELKKELMETIFHPRNMHKFVDWGFIDESDLDL